MEPYQIQPASVDLRVGDSFLYTLEEKHDRYIHLDEKETGVYDKRCAKKKTQAQIIEAYDFVLATTIERIKLPNNVVALIDGRSSIGRLGLFVENAGWIDPGFEGEITLELYNANCRPIHLDYGRRIAQIAFCWMDQEVENPYRGKYQGQTGATGSKIWQDEEIIIKERRKWASKQEQ